MGALCGSGPGLFPLVETQTSAGATVVTAKMVVTVAGALSCVSGLGDPC